ncbi:30S ribosomal protein S17 [Methanococcoides sp. SA1]|nr:30S ribosomal protein S17 [Methanococcoides sp. SA1]
MVEKKNTKTGKGKKLSAEVRGSTRKGEVKVSCKDRLCPKHGDRKLKMRGRVFEGKVVKVLPGRVSIEFERMLKLPKYERFEKRKTKIHARLPDCMKGDVVVGDLIEIAETRPISKMIHFVVSKVVRKVEVKA